MNPLEDEKFKKKDDRWHGRMNSEIKKFLRKRGLLSAQEIIDEYISNNIKVIRGKLSLKKRR
jgi:hypothetical protein